MYLPEVGNVLHPKNTKTDPNGKSTFFQSVSQKNWFSRNRSFFSSLGMYQVYILYIHIQIVRGWIYPPIIPMTGCHIRKYESLVTWKCESIELSGYTDICCILTIVLGVPSPYIWGLKCKMVSKGFTPAEPTCSDRKVLSFRFPEPSKTMAAASHLALRQKWARRSCWSTVLLPFLSEVGLQLASILVGFIVDISQCIIYLSIYLI